MMISSYFEWHAYVILIMKYALKHPDAAWSDVDMLNLINDRVPHLFDGTVGVAGLVFIPFDVVERTRHSRYFWEDLNYELCDALEGFLS